MQGCTPAQPMVEFDYQLLGGYTGVQPNAVYIRA